MLGFYFLGGGPSANGSQYSESEAPPRQPTPSTHPVNPPGAHPVGTAKAGLGNSWVETSGCQLTGS